MTNKPIQVYYKYVDGAHFFVSYEKEAAGLCVANGDLKKAFDAVGEQLHILYRVGRRENVIFTPAIPFEVFARKVRTLIRDLDGPDEDDLTPAAISKWTRGRGIPLQ